MPSQLSEEKYNRLKKKYSEEYNRLKKKHPEEHNRLKKYSAEKDYKKILKYSKRKRTKFGKQIDQYWRQRDVQRLIDKGVINTKIQMKEVKKLLDEIK